MTLLQSMYYVAKTDDGHKQKVRSAHSAKLMTIRVAALRTTSNINFLDSLLFLPNTSPLSPAGLFYSNFSSTQHDAG